MLEISVDVDVSVLQGALKQLASGQLPRTAEAVRNATLLVQRTWLQAASGREVTYQGRTFSLRRVSGAYASSIQHGLTYPDGDALSGRVTANTPYATAIEQGSAPRDMKPGLLSGPKARRGKNGSIYTIIPFRHGTPGSTTMRAMPQEIYRQARQMAFSRITGSREETNAWGDVVKRNTYHWGDRLANTSTGWRSRIAPKGQEYTHTTSIFSGMVRMGDARHSQFMTFRVVSTNSPTNSWWSPGVEPKPVAAAVASMVEPHVFAMVRAAFAEDLALLGVD